MKAAAVTLLLALVAWPLTAQQSVNQKKGFQAENVYSVQDIDAINAFNGNLTVSIPIGPTFPIADNLSYGLVLHSNGNLWDSVVDGDDSDYNPAKTSNGGPASEATGQCDRLDGITVAVPHRRSNAGMGWTLTMGRLFDPSDRTSGGGWVYESPDGADHKFWETLHEPILGGATEPTGEDGFMYTRDGTYLRMRTVDATTREIEFPNGSIHTFKPPAAGLNAWMPTKIRNRFSANFLNIAYTGTSDAPIWTLTDNHGRTHRVIFESLEWNGSTRPMVKTVDLLAFGTDANGVVTEKRALYEFKYSPRTIGRTEWSEKCTPYANLVNIQSLDSIQFPDDPTNDDDGLTAYQFTYQLSTNWRDDNGLLRSAVLPTGAMIKWTWSQYHKPTESADAIEAHLRGSWGVERRELYETAAGTNLLATTTYDDTLDDNYIDEGNGDTDVYPREMKNVITDALGNRTVNYFSVSVYNYPASSPLWEAGDYGRPFTRYHSLARTASDKLWLSSVVYPAGAVIDPAAPLHNALKATYVRYDRDPSTISFEDRNWRVSSSRVVWPRADENVDNPALIADYVDTDFTSFDGLGHYRTTKVSGPSVSKTTTTKYNPTQNDFPTASFVMFPTSANWVLDTYTFTETTQGTATSRTDFCFDSNTGFLKGRRVSRGLRVNGISQPTFDQLTVYKDTTGNDGNPDVEESFGGQVKPLSAGIDTCSGSATPEYSVKHGYSYGVHSSSNHSGWTFKSLDLTIDPTGVPSASRDVSGLITTRYVYNPIGQLRELRPQGEAWTEYLYNVNPASEPRASVRVKQRALDGTLLTESRYYYDSSARLVQQRSWMGTMEANSFPWSASTITYDALGRKESTSVPMGVSSGSWGTITPPGKTVWGYDALGRTRKITQPDLSVTDIVHTGASEVARTSTIKTAAGEVPVTTVESMDAFGRLESVTEDSTGDAFQTLYQYDEGDRLAKVIAGIQTRTFDYDGAGLLTEEDHPESDATSYEYDSRGHMTKRKTTGSTLRYVYDSAERLTTVLHDPDGTGASPEVIMQEFTFGTTGVGLGRPRTAKGHNYHPDLGGDALVTETFDYDATGRISAHTTSVTLGANTRTFTDSYTYDPLGAVQTITYPGCSGCGFTPPARLITNDYKQGLLSSVSGYASSIVYHPNGLWAQFVRPNVNGTAGPIDIQTVAPHGMPRPAALSVTGYCTDFSVSALPSAKTVQKGDPAGLSVTAAGATAYQWYNGETAIPGATAANYNAPVNSTSSFWVRVGNGTCTVDSNVAVVTVASCNVTPTISAPQSVKLGATGLTASVQESGSYAWTIQNGTITSGANSQTVTFTAGCSGSVQLTVSFTPSCGGSPQSKSKDVPITVPIVTLTATPDTISQGSSSTLNAQVNSAGPWSLTWGDSATSATTRTVSPSGTTTYQITQVNGCPATPSWASKTVTVVPPAPLTTVAAKSGLTSILVTWTNAAGASIDSYRIERCTTSCNGVGNWTVAGTALTTSFNDTGRTANAAYAYRVWSVRSATSSATASPPDFASTFAFSDDPVAVGSAPMAIHLSELRSAVNALRTAAGYGPYNYTDTVSAGLLMKALHLTQLRTALNEARAAFGVPAMNFTQSTPVSGGRISASHINDLRGGVQ